MPEHTPAPTPSRAVYGFAMYLSFKLLFIFYVLWALLPESLFRYLGITCLPQRYWAVAVPIFLLTVVAVFGFVIYPSLNFCMTPRIDDIATIQEKQLSKVAKNVIFEELLASSNKNSLNKCCKNSKKCKYKEFLEVEKSSNLHGIPPVNYLITGSNTI